MNLQNLSHTKKGFTLIEILISLTLISALLSFILFAYKEYIIQMQETSAKYEAILLLKQKIEEVKINPEQMEPFGEEIQNNIRLKWTIDKTSHKENTLKATVTVFYKPKEDAKMHRLDSFIVLPT